MILINTPFGIKKTSTGTAKTSLNNFKGWYCNAGTDFLWINDKGYIYGNVCRHSGCYGNLYTSFTLPTEPMICPAQSCYCAADIEIFKSKTKENFVDFSQDVSKEDLSHIEEYNGDEIISVAGVSKIPEYKYFCINWNIGKRCNYSCSYCPPTVHDNFSPHMKFETFKSAIDKIMSSITVSRIQITFTGGEPTINPDFFKIIGYCKEKEIRVFTNTNGTCTAAKLLSLVEVGGVSISVHPEFTQEEKLVKKINEVLKNNITGSLKVKYMLIPGGLDKCKNFVNLLPERTSNFKLSIEPLVDKNNDRKILEYTQEELEYIQKCK